MFRSYADTVRTPIDIEKLESEPKPISDAYECDICREPWLTETDVDIHKKKEHLSEIISMIRNEEEHYCLICVRAQGSAKNLVSHIKSDHLLSSPTAQRVEREIFICDHCENIFFNKRLLTAHIQYIHRDKLNRDFLIPCPKCNKCFKVQKMWFHLNFHQLNLNSTCDICLIACTTRNQKREHVATHPGYYHCDDCNISVNKKQFFDEHIMTHKKRNPHLIDGNLRRFFAPKSAVAPWKYRIESRTKGLQLYDLSICIMCREICTSAAEMSRHILVDHAPEKEVKHKPMCVCGEEFFNTVLLKHHVFKLKGIHRILGEGETPLPSLLDLPPEPSPEICGGNVAQSQPVGGASEETLPVDCELFTMQDLGPTEDEVVVHNSV